MRLGDRFRESRPWPIVWFALVALVVIAYTVSVVPIRHGDGHEYSVTTEAFIRHLTPDIEAADVQARIDQIHHYSSLEYSAEYFEKIKDTITSNGTDWGGIYRAKSGLYYGYHFWLYPAVVSVVERLLLLVGTNPLVSFQVTNGLLLLFGTAYCVFSVGESAGRRYGAAAALWLGGSLFYLQWTHPRSLFWPPRTSSASSRSSNADIWRRCCYSTLLRCK